MRTIKTTKIFNYDLIKSTTFIILVSTIILSNCIVIHPFVESTTIPQYLILFAGVNSFAIMMLVKVIIFKKSINNDIYTIIVAIVGLTLLLSSAISATHINDLTIIGNILLYGVLLRQIKDMFSLPLALSIAMIISALLSSIRVLKQLINKQELIGCSDNVVGLSILLVLGILSIIFIIQTNTNK